MSRRPHGELGREQGTMVNLTKSPTPVAADNAVTDATVRGLRYLSDAALSSVWALAIASDRDDMVAAVWDEYVFRGRVAAVLSSRVIL